MDDIVSGCGVPAASGVAAPAIAASQDKGLVRVTDVVPDVSMD